MGKDFQKKAKAAPVMNAMDAILLTQEEQAAQEAQDTQKTQGRKGMKAARINMAFTPDNYDYIRVMGGMRGESMTNFVNYVIEEHRRLHGEKYAQAKAIMNDM